MTSSPFQKPPPNARDVKRGRPNATAEKVASMKADIAEVARALFLAEGYRAVSMRRIAAGVGCSPMSLYSYYPAKIDILRHLWAVVFETLFSDLVVAANHISEPRAKLLAVSCRYVRYWISHPDHYRMVFMTEGITQTQVADFVTSEADDVVGQFHLFFALVSRAMEIKEEDAKLAGETLICALNGIAHCHITMSGYAWSRSDDLVTMIVNGLVRDQRITPTDRLP